MQAICVDWTFISWTAETFYWLLATSVNWRWTTLLQANYVAAEAEAEIARVISGYLLCRHIHLASISTGAWTKGSVLLVIFLNWWPINVAILNAWWIHWWLWIVIWLRRDFFVNWFPCPSRMLDRWVGDRGGGRRLRGCLIQ